MTAHTPIHPATQADKLDALIAPRVFVPIELTAREEVQCQLHRLASAALAAAAKVDADGNVLHTAAGIALYHAMHDFTGEDALYDKALELESEFAPASDYAEHQADVRWAREVRR